MHKLFSPSFDSSCKIPPSPPPGHSFGKLRGTIRKLPLVGENEGGRFYFIKLSNKMCDRISHSRHLSASLTDDATSRSTRSSTSRTKIVKRAWRRRRKGRVLVRGGSAESGAALTPIPGAYIHSGGGGEFGEERRRRTQTRRTVRKTTCALRPSRTRAVVLCVSVRLVRFSVLCFVIAVGSIVFARIVSRFARRVQTISDIVQTVTAVNKRTVIAGRETLCVRDKTAADHPATATATIQQPRRSQPYSNRDDHDRGLIDLSATLMLCRAAHPTAIATLSVSRLESRIRIDPQN